METAVEAGPKKFVVPIGPQHPALKEPGHFEITVDGEVVTGATARLGYVHRGIEKGVEGHNWAQSMYMLERICGICSHVHATAYALGVEALAGVTAPPRAQAIRVLVAELERIHSHFLWLGVAAHEGGFDTLFMYSWRDREAIMDVLEGLTGNRVNYSCNVLGGVKFDVDDKHADAIRRAIDLLEPRTHHYLKIVTTDETLIGRIRGVGKMTAEESERLGAVGPTARASGVPRDIRVDAPYAAYPDFPVKMITGTGGDLEAKFIVRLQELFESYRVVREILDKLPAGDLSVRVKPRVPAGEIDQPGRGAPRRAVLLPQERRRTQPGSLQGADAEHLQLGFGHRHGARPQARRHPDAAGRHRPLLLLQRPPRHRAPAQGRRRNVDLEATPPIRNRVLPMTNPFPPLIALLFIPGGLFLLSVGTGVRVGRSQARRPVPEPCRARGGSSRWPTSFKLLAKEEVVPDGVNPALFHALPVVALAGSLAAALYVPMAGVAPSYSFRGDLVVTLYLLSLMTLCMGLAGANTINRFSLVGATRALTQLFSYEAPFLLALLGPAIVANSWQIGEVNSFAGQHWWIAVDPADGLRRRDRRPDGQAGTAAVRLARGGDRNRRRTDDRIQRPRLGAVPHRPRRRAARRPDADGRLLHGRHPQPLRLHLEDRRAAGRHRGPAVALRPPANRPDRRPVVADWHSAGARPAAGAGLYNPIRLDRHDS